MSDEELLPIVCYVLAAAIATAEFTHLPKDVAYCNIVAEKVEFLRAKVGNHPPVTITMNLIDGRMHTEYALPSISLAERK